MLEKLKQLLRRHRKQRTPSLSEEQASAWHERKSSLMVSMLGRERDCWHGNRNQEVVQNAGPGLVQSRIFLLRTGDVHALCDRHRTGPRRHLAFGQAHQNISAILNVMAPYSTQASLNILIEILRTEMNHARGHGSAKLIDQLTTTRHYPYPNFDRAPVV